MTDDDGFEALLEHLKRSRSFDLTGYKRASLTRRVNKRMHQIGVETYEEYLDCLEVQPEEFDALLDAILINVTSFFRDPPMWEYVEKTVVPAIAERSEGRAIRVWSAGCASGEEAYTMAMVFGEALGETLLRERLKVFATDVDQPALAQARQGEYDAAAVKAVPEGLRDRYFESFGDRYVFRKDLRRSVIFGRNDLAQDAPISRVDLLVCRNTLMYFHASTQTEILRRFHFALQDGGFLFLGKSEMLTRHAELFTPLHNRWRVLTKVAAAGERWRPLSADPLADAPSAGSTALRDSALDAVPVAQVVIDNAGTVTLINHEARRMFDLRMNDVGRRLQDLELSYRPIELRSLVDRALNEQRTVHVEDVVWAPPHRDARRLAVELRPLVSVGSPRHGVSITFADLTAIQDLQTQLDRLRYERDAAGEELQSMIEELETTNEELQSTNEELETTNEELQSTNEELETMNEELQSSNAELETVNDELRDRSGELDSVNIFLKGILTSLQVAVIVVGSGLDVEMWNSMAEELWGLRDGEVVGHKFLELDIGLPVKELGKPLRACLSGDSPREQRMLSATNRRGRPVDVEVSIVPLRDPAAEVRGAIVLVAVDGRPA